MEVPRYEFTVQYAYDETFGGRTFSNALMSPKKTGSYVRYEDYKHLSDYCDHLVAFSKLPCLPKDLENLRNSNASMADEINRLTAENEKLKQSINKISHIINKND